MLSSCQLPLPRVLPPCPPEPSASAAAAAEELGGLDHCTPCFLAGPLVLSAVPAPHLCRAVSAPPDRISHELLGTSIARTCVQTRYTEELKAKSCFIIAGKGFLIWRHNIGFRFLGVLCRYT